VRNRLKTNGLLKSVWILFSMRCALYRTCGELTENEWVVGEFFANEWALRDVIVPLGRGAGQNFCGDVGCFRFMREHSIFYTCESIIICILFE
jgi:hypothetical protein